MKDKKLKEAFGAYIAKESDKAVSYDVDLSGLDSRVYASLHSEPHNNHKPMRMLYKIGSLAAAFLLVIGLTVIITLQLSKSVEVIAAQDCAYTVAILYNKVEYGYLTNQYVTDKYGEFTLTGEPVGILTAENLKYVKQPIKEENLIGLSIYRITESILVIGSENSGYYYFEISVAD